LPNNQFFSLFYWVSNDLGVIFEAQISLRMARYSKYFSPILFLGDLLILNFSFVLGYFIRFGKIEGVWLVPYLYLLIFVNIAWGIVAAVTDPYQIARTARVAKIIRSHLAIIILHLLLVTAFFVFQKAYFYSRLQLVLTYSFFIGIMLIWRVGFIYLLRIYRIRGFNRRNVVVVGFGELTRELQKFFRLHPEHGYKFLGYFDNNEQNSWHLGNFSAMFSYCKQNSVDEIYCCLPYVKYSDIKKIVDFGEDNLIKVKLIADFRGFSFKGLELQRYDHIPVLNVTNIPLDEWKNRVVKRTFDIVFSSLVILLILTWLTPLVGLLVMITSRGPVFFMQKRTGKNNKSFICFKFRTMEVNKDADSLQATTKDPRITPIGSFLRKTSIDELPQFFNVLMGDMSVVGPRPHMIKHTKEYSKVVEKFMARHFVKPGITGLAQAKGYRGETKTVELMKSRVRLDRFYIENWSLVLDLKIIALTIPQLFNGSERAY
jgi:Undecaprenyl-phosphate glucose phosphotransferase